MDPAHVMDGEPPESIARGSCDESILSNPFPYDQGRYPSAAFDYARSHHGNQADGSAEEYDRACVVYVGGLHSNIDDRILFDTFRQFGPIVNVIRRSVNFEVKPQGAGQYAFIRFTNPQDAQHAIHVGEINLEGSKLTIKSRDKKGPNHARVISNGYSEYKQRFGDRSGNHILRMLHKNHRGGPPVGNLISPYDQQSDPHMMMSVAPTMDSPGRYTNATSVSMAPGGSTAGSAPRFMSKALIAANLPMDMSPKELFTLFSNVGRVEGCYIFPIPDQIGRRFGQIVMASFFLAQKAREAFNRYIVRDCSIEVTYRSDLGPASSNASISTMSAIPSPATMTAPVYYPGSQQIGWPVPPHYGTGHPGMLAPMMPFAHPYLQIPNGAHMLPYPAYNPPGGIPIPEMDPTQIHSMPLTNPSHSPSSGFGYRGPMVNKTYTNRPYHRNNRSMPIRSASAEVSTNFCTSQNLSRCVSDSSSSTLVSAGYDRAGQGPLIVNGSYKSAYETPSPPKGCFKDEVPCSDKESTPSPIAVRSSGRDLLRDALPPPQKPKFEVLTPPVIPETTKPTDPANLFVKNLDDSAVSSAEDLNNLFKPFGKVASTHLATYSGSGISKGFGFVAFSNSEDAEAAKMGLNGTMVGQKRIFISYAERKEERVQRLKNLFEKKKKGEIITGDGVDASGRAMLDIGLIEKEDTNSGDQFQDIEKDDNQLYSAESSSVNSGDPSDDRSDGSSGFSSRNGDVPEEPSGGDRNFPVTKKALEFDFTKTTSTASANYQPQFVTSESFESIPAVGSDKRLGLTRSTKDGQQILTEQEITVTTTVTTTKGWRGTQLTGIAEVEEDEGSRFIGLQQNVALLSANRSYVHPSSVQNHKPSHTSLPCDLSSGQTIPDHLFKDQEQPNTLASVTKGVVQQYNNLHPIIHAPQELPPSRSPSPRKSLRFQNQEQAGRSFYKNNNNIGGYGRGGSRIPIHNRNGNGDSQGYNIPTGPRAPPFNIINPNGQTLSSDRSTDGVTKVKKKKWHNNRNNRSQKSQAPSSAEHISPKVMAEKRMTDQFGTA